MKLLPGVWAEPGATSLDVQVGRLWVSFTYPRYWLFSRTRLAGLRTVQRMNLRCRCWRCRAWLFAWPGFVRIAERNDA